MLPVPVKARLVRIRPLLSSHDEKACVRLEIYGCTKANAGEYEKRTVLSFHIKPGSSRVPDETQVYF